MSGGKLASLVYSVREHSLEKRRGNRWHWREPAQWVERLCG
jgi:hypothetical protein